MAEQYIKKIRTASGDLQIDYLALANLPTVATQSDNGLLSAADKQKLDNISLTAVDDGNGNITLLWSSTEAVLVVSSDGEGTLSLS